MSFEQIKVEELKLDPSNPRLPVRLHNVSDADVINWMLTDATLLDLMASIAENGFFEGEPIIVEQDSNIVIEGNRRVAAIRLLKSPDIAVEKQKSVKELSALALIKNNIPEEIWVHKVNPRSSAENYLGFRHVTGIKTWPSISKAKYLYNVLYKNKILQPDIYRTIAREIGSKGAYVKKLITGYRLFEIISQNNFYGIDNEINEENIEFSYISDSLGLSGTTEFLEVDMDAIDPLVTLNNKHLSELTKIYYEKNDEGETKIGETRNLKILSRVLQNEKAKTAFLLEGISLEDAATLTDYLEETLREYYRIALYNLLEAQKQIHKIEIPNRDDVELLKEIIASGEIQQTAIRRRLMDIEVSK
jgi:hypothetical protein